MKTAFRILGWTAAIFAFLLSFSIIFLPTLLSTKWGLRQGLAEINHRINGTIAVEDATFSWIGGQQLSTILVKDANQQKIISIDKIDLSQSLFSLLISGFNFSATKVTELNAEVVIDTGGNSNLLYALQRQNSGTPLLKDKALKSLFIHHTNGVISPPQSDGSILISATGKTREESLEGDFTIEAIKAAGEINGVDDLTLKVQINNFPVDLIEQMIVLEHTQLKGIIQAAIGQTINVKIDKNKKKDSHSSSWEVISPNININFEAAIDTTRFTLLTPARAEIQLTPQLFNLLTQDHFAGIPLSLKTTSLLSINIQELDIPLAQTKLQEKELTVVAGFLLKNGQIGSGLLSKDILIQGLNGQINASQGLSKATLDMEGIAGQEGKENSITIGAKVSIPMVNIISPNRLYTKGAFELKGEIATKTPLAISSPIDGSTLIIDTLATTVNGTSLSDLNSTIKMIMGPSENGEIAQLIGANTKVKISTLIALDPKGTIKLNDIYATVSGEKVNMEMRGELHENKITLLSPASLKMTLNPETIHQLIAMRGPLKEEPQLSHSSTIAMTIAPVSAHLTKEGLHQLNISGHLQMDLLAMTVKGETLLIKELVAPWEIDGQEGKIKINFSGKTRLETSDKANEGTFRGKFTSKNLLSDQTTQTKLEATLVDFPSELIALVLNKPEAYSFLGPVISANIELVSPLQNGAGQLELSLHGEGIYVEAAVKIDDAIVLADSNKPAKIEIDISPARFSSLIAFMGSPSHQSTLMIEETAKALFIIDHLNIPLFSDKEKQVEYWKAAILGELKVDHLILVDKKEQKRTTVDTLKMVIESKSIGENLQLNLNAALKDDKMVAGQLTVKGAINELFKTKGVLNTEGLSLSLDLKAENLHVNLLNRLLSPYPTMPEKLEAVLGDPVNGQVGIDLVKMNGPINARFTGTNGRFTLDSTLVNGDLFLSQPFTVEVTATPMLGKYLLSDIVPFLEGLKSADDRIKINIQDIGFHFPIKAFDIAKVTIPKATIEVGKMQLSGEGNMRTILGLLGKDKHQTFTAWLTPIYFNMQKGTLKLERVDMLLDNVFPLAAWGSIDFIKDKVNMVIGIRGTAIANAFNLVDLSPDYMLQLPLKGSTNNPSIDKRKAAARISALVAQTQGPQGMLVGTVLEVASGSLTDNPAPPPTTTPFPWDDKELKVKKVNPVQNEIKKSASSLLQGLIK